MDQAELPGGVRFADHKQRTRHPKSGPRDLLDHTGGKEVGNAGTEGVPKSGIARKNRRTEVARGSREHAGGHAVPKEARNRGAKETLPRRQAGSHALERREPLQIVVYWRAERPPADDGRRLPRPEAGAAGAPDPAPEGAGAAAAVRERAALPAAARLRR
ncbi:MAG: hypothetical protein GY772_21530, partial [bacterium]|nr:hypothetical protein [bacterium]